MKWSNEQTAELRAMCMNGSSNAEMATTFCVPVTEIYAARSRFGITREKIAQLKSAKPAVRKPAIENPSFKAAVDSMVAQYTATPRCLFCDSQAELLELLNKPVCLSCAYKLGSELL